jgi:dCTP deaminase
MNLHELEIQGMFIVDHDLKRLIREGHLIIQSANADMPFDPDKQIGSASIDLMLDNLFIRYKDSVDTIDLAVTADTEYFSVPQGEDLVIQPRELILGTSVENVIIPPNIVGFISSRSSIARLGLVVVTQIYIQPGHAQRIALQLVNVTDRPIKIKPFLKVCQIMLCYATSPAQVPYNSKPDAKYRGEIAGPEPSKIGVELGLDRRQDVSMALNISPNRELAETVAQLTKGVGIAPSTSTAEPKLSGVLAVVYIILGAGISQIISELDTKPFPSVKLLVGASFCVFCLALLAVAYWRR